jgi:hypothetical protein
LLIFSQTTFAEEIRSIDGSGNNIVNPDWGRANTQLRRLATPAYEDGVSVPRGGDPSSLPSARAISNAVSAQSGSVLNAVNASDWLWQWGQFLDHDIDLTGPAVPTESFNIPVPTGDPFFDPFSFGDQEIGLDRSTFDPATGTMAGNPRQQLNGITSYIDGSNVYGSDQMRADDLRTLDGTGMLRTSTADNGEVVLPFNTSNLPNAGGTGSDLYIAGDVRANEQVGLTATHTILLREHNRLAADIAHRLSIGDPDIEGMRDEFLTVNPGSIEGDFIYESARKLVGAQIQAITYGEFLPLLLGPDAIDLLSGYDDNVNVGISNEFSTAAYRFAHTMLPSQLLRLNDDGTTVMVGNIPLQDGFFNPDEVSANGVDSLLLGLASQPAQAIDTLLVDDVRNFLFGPPGAGGFDLASLDIQRGREHGLPSLNQARADLGLAPYNNFEEMAGGDNALAAAFETVYGMGNIDDVDLWIGGLGENTVVNAMVGETFFEILADQFQRLRDGDRFFYLDRLDYLLALDPNLLDVTLSELILRNSSITSIQENAFLYMGGVPEPTTVALLSVGLAGLGFVRRRLR